MGRRPQGEGGLKVRVASVGKDRSGLFAPGVEEYAGRLRHYTSFSLVELPAFKGNKPRALEEEGKALLGLRGPRDQLVALDERGALFDSLEFSRFVGRAQTQGKDLLFVLGGDEGLAPEVRQAAQNTLALSKMTLPHRLARLLLVEQLYRAFTVLRGEPYHK